MTEGRDHWWHRLLDARVGRLPSPRRWTPRTCCSSSTPRAPPGSPRASSTPPAATSRTSTSTTKHVFDLKDEDVFWCTADIGWVTGHSYVVYGPLANGATVLMYEGAPDWPERDRFWSDRRALRRHHPLHRADRDPRLHEVGHRASRAARPLHPAAAGHRWASRSIRRPGSGTTSTSAASRCPIVDTWWQTETGGIMITPLPGVTTTKPGSATIPFPGIAPSWWTPRASGSRRAAASSPSPQPWPGMLRTIYGDDERYRETYWSRFPGRYFAGDGAKLDEDGYWWILGRVDDVLNVAGHRIGTMEVESALVDHPAVAEAAVVGPGARAQGTGAGGVRHPQGRAASRRRSSRTSSRRT